MVRSITAGCEHEGGTLWRVVVLQSGAAPFTICTPHDCDPRPHAERMSHSSDLSGRGSWAVQLEELTDWRELHLDIVIPGMAKAGTTWLARQLSCHRDVYIHGFHFDKYGEEFPLDAEEGAYWPTRRHVYRWNRQHRSNKTLIGVKQPGYLQSE